MRRAIIRTAHEDPAIIAAAVSPDHTSAISTDVHEGEIETTIERASTGSLHSTVDDYLVNLGVAVKTNARTQIETMTTTEHTETDQ